MTVDLALAPTSNTSGLGLGLEDLWPWPWPRRLLALALASTMLSSNTSLRLSWPRWLVTYCGTHSFSKQISCYSSLTNEVGLLVFIQNIAAREKRHGIYVVLPWKITKTICQQYLETDRHTNEW